MYAVDLFLQHLCHAILHADRVYFYLSRWVCVHHSVFFNQVSRCAFSPHSAAQRRPAIMCAVGAWRSHDRVMCKWLHVHIHVC